MDRKQHYKRFFILVALFGLITSSVVYAAEDSPFPDVTEPAAPINEILPDLPQLVEPEDPKPEELEPEEEKPVEAPDYVGQPVDPDREWLEAPAEGISDDDLPDDTVSGDDTEDPEHSPKNQEDNSGNGRNINNPTIIIPDNINADNYYSSSLSYDAIKLEYLEYITNEIVSINEVINLNEQTQKDILTKLSGIERNEQAYKKAVLEFILSFENSLSGNKIKVYTDEISVSLDAAALGEFMNNTISENEPETVSENTPDPEPEETVSDDDIETISDDVVSISKGDIDQLHKDNEQLHDDLKSIFYVGLFGVIFLAMIAAGNLEQIIFKRLRG